MNTGSSQIRLLGMILIRISGDVKMRLYTDQASHVDQPEKVDVQ